MGWTGGYCLVAFFLAPYLRKFGQFTIPVVWLSVKQTSVQIPQAMYG